MVTVRPEVVAALAAARAAALESPQGWAAFAAAEFEHHPTPAEKDAARATPIEPTEKEDEP